STETSRENRGFSAAARSARGFPPGNARQQGRAPQDGAPGRGHQGVRRFMKAIVFDRFGPPGEVLYVKDVPAPEPGPGQVRGRMPASRVTPSDRLVVRGQCGRLPDLPATPGFEGVGVVDAAGPGLLKLLRGLKPGRRVAVLNPRGGNWQEQVVV